MTFAMLAFIFGTILIYSALNAFAVKPAAERNDKWRVIGMGGGGTMQFPLISPHDPELILNACDMTGAYISRDGGDSWRMFNLRTGVTAYAFDPKDENTIYGGGPALFRSKDKGNTWELMLPNVDMGTYESHRGDHGDYGIDSEDPAYPTTCIDVRITALIVDPNDSDVIYVAFSEGHENTGAPVLSGTRDGGRTFRKIAELETNAKAIVVPTGGGDPVIVHAESVTRFVDGKPVTTPLPDGIKIVDVSVGESAEGPVIWATAWSQNADGSANSKVLVSRDLAESWRDVSDSLKPVVAGENEANIFISIACQMKDPDVCYIGSRRERADRTPDDPWEPPRGGKISKTTDGGSTWTVVHREGPDQAENHKPSWQEMRMHEGDSIWFDPARCIAVAPTDPNVCFATDLFRSYRTNDGGKTWESVTSVDRGGGQWTTSGLDVTTCYGLHFDPFNTDNMFISYTDMAAWRSTDGGGSWINSFEGIPKKWRNTCYWAAYDPEVEGLMWGAWAGAHDIPRSKMWRTSGWNRYPGGMATSTDGGKTWEITSDGIDETAVTHVLMEPDSPVGSRTLYACAFAKGLYRSDDNGKTWTVKNNGIEQTEPFVWRTVMSPDGSLYLIVARRTAELKTYTDNDRGGLYVSTDKAETWKKVNLPDVCTGPNGLHIDPKNPKRMYLAAWGDGDARSADVGGGIYMTNDGGNTWEHVFDGDQHVYDVTHDPRNGRLYACGFDARAWYSEDDGVVWKPIRGYNFHWGHRVVPDPLDAEKVYITTYGGSIWHGPATGDPDAVEDVVTKIPRKL